MAEKELKIIYAEEVPQQDFRPIPWQIRMEAGESGMKAFYSAHWVYPKPGEGAAPAPRQVLAYGDSAGDVPMLRLSSAPVLVSPGKKAAAMLPEAKVVHWAQ